MIELLAVLQIAAAVGARPIVPDKCAASSSDEIVVCRERNGQSPYRLPKLPDKYAPKPVRAETDVIPGIHTRAHVQSERRPDGNIAKRLLVTFSLPL